MSLLEMLDRLSKVREVDKRRMVHLTEAEAKAISEKLIAANRIFQNGRRAAKLNPDVGLITAIKLFIDAGKE